MALSTRDTIDAPEPKKTPAKTAPTKATADKPTPGKKTFTDHATGFAGDARQLAEKIRGDIGKLRTDVQKYYEKAAPETYEAPVHAGMSRLMSTVDDLDRALDGVMQTAADLDRTGTEVTPPTA